MQHTNQIVDYLTKWGFTVKVTAEYTEDTDTQIDVADFWGNYGIIHVQVGYFDGVYYCANRIVEDGVIQGKICNSLSELKQELAFMVREFAAATI